MPINQITKTKKRTRSCAKTDEVLKVCPVCNGVWSNMSIQGEREYSFYPRGIPTIGKKRVPCREHGGGK